MDAREQAVREVAAAEIHVGWCGADVLLAFRRPTLYLRMTPGQARALAEYLNTHARESENRCQPR